MDEAAFRSYLRRQGRSESAVDRCIARTNDYLDWLEKNHQQVGALSLTRFVGAVEADSSAKSHLWALAYYFDYVGNQELAERAHRMRRERVADRTLAIGKLEGVSPQLAGKLAAKGIDTTRALVDATASGAQLDSLAMDLEVTTIDLSHVREMCRLAEIRGVSTARARLYADCFRSIDVMAQLTAADLIEQTRAYIEATGSARVPPTPKEAEFTIEEARRLAG